MQMPKVLTSLLPDPPQPLLRAGILIARLEPVKLPTGDRRRPAPLGGIPFACTSDLRWLRPQSEGGAGLFTHTSSPARNTYNRQVVARLIEYVWRSPIA